MKKVFYLAAVVLLMFSAGADACVGKILNVGVVSSREGQILAEMLSSLINERTGTTVEIRLYESIEDLYEGVRMREVEMLVENTSRALQVLGRPLETDPTRAYELVKEAYAKEKGLVWLKPFGFLSGEVPSYSAALLRDDVITNFPALPRVINKLANAVNDDAYRKLVKSVEAGEEPKAVARDFLKSKKLI